MSTKVRRRCATSPSNAEYSLCGDSWDAFDSGDAEEPFEFAEDGQTINCEECCKVIREIKKLRNPLRPRSDWLKNRHLELAQESER